MRNALLAFLMLALSAFADAPKAPDATPGNGAGNGGFAYVRRNKISGAIEEVRFHDLWWGEKELGLRIRRTGVLAEKQAKDFVSRLLTLDEKRFAGLPQELNRVIREKKIVDEDVKIVEPKDLYKHVEPAPNSSASVEALINYTDDGVILLRRDLWTFLTDPKRAETDVETDIAAAYVHEALYKLIRNEGPKPPTSKEAAAIVAHGFSTLDDAAFAHWYEYFRKTGNILLPDNVKEVQINESIDSAIFSSGDVTKDQADAKADWANKCKQWRAAVLAELEPKSDYVYALCREMTYSRVVDDKAYFAYSLGSIRAKPKRAYLTARESVRGKMMPIHGPKGWPKWYAIQSHRENCETWKKEAAAQLGKRLFYASCGENTISTPDRYSHTEYVPRSVMFGNHRSYLPLSQGAESATPKYVELAHQALSRATVVILQDGDWTYDSKKVTGALYGYNEFSAEAALESANDAFEAACTDWKKSNAGEKTIYVTCDNAELDDGVRDIPYAVRKAVGQVQFESWGRVYHLR